MKNLLYLFLVGILFSCGGAGESDEPNPEEPDVNGEPKEYVVSLGMVGEIEISESPLLGRATPNDLYGIQVYSKTATTEYTPYAYGLFDDKSKMTIKLLEGYQYKFIATMVVDGKNRITAYNKAYDAPFSIQGAPDKSILTNSFILSNNLYFTYLCVGFSKLNGINDILSRPNIDRYYGEILNYSPSENGKVVLNMKRVVFGAKFIAEGLSEGMLHISIHGAPQMIIKHDGNQSIESILSFENDDHSSKWNDDDYSETIPVSITWEKADGAIVPLINQDITFKRKILSTITIKVKDTSINNGVEINQEAGDLMPGEDITLESGTGIDKPVEPNI